MDDIIAKISNSTIIEDEHPLHPRFGDFKNEGKIAEQQRLRRHEQLERQNWFLNIFWF